MVLLGFHVRGPRVCSQRPEPAPGSRILTEDLPSMKIHAKPSLLGLLLFVAGCAGNDPAAPVSRVVLIGIESFSREHVLGMIDEGELPNLARMIREGSRAKLISPDPLQSQMLWATMLTGQGAQKHQMAAEYVKLDAGVLCAPSSMRIVPTIFQAATQNQASVAAIGFPGTWPAEVVNGFNLSYGALPSRMTEAVEHTYERDPKDRAAFPATLRDDALVHYTPVEDMDRRETAPFFVLNEAEFTMLYDLPLGSVYRRENPLKDFAITLMRDRAQVTLAEQMLSDYPIRLAGVHIELPEALQLPYWGASYPDHYELPANSVRRYGKTVDEAYRQIDAAVGRLIQAAGEGAVICVAGNRGFGNVSVADPETGQERLVPAQSNESLLLLYGQGILRGQDLGTVDLVDIAPTLLTALDLPVGDRMDGRVLEPAFTEGFLASHPRKATEPYSEDFVQNPARYPSGMAGEQ